MKKHSDVIYERTLLEPQISKIDIFRVSKETRSSRKIEKFYLNLLKSGLNPINYSAF